MIVTWLKWWVWEHGWIILIDFSKKKIIIIKAYSSYRAMNMKFKRSMKMLETQMQSFTGWWAAIKLQDSNIASFKDQNTVMKVPILLNCQSLHHSIAGHWSMFFEIIYFWLKLSIKSKYSSYRKTIIQHRHHDKLDKGCCDFNEQTSQSQVRSLGVVTENQLCLNRNC